MWRWKTLPVDGKKVMKQYLSRYESDQKERTTTLTIISYYEKQKLY
jgi:hypothetical protein